MKIYIGADHGGYKFKEQLLVWLRSLEYEVEDCGAYEFNPEDDYPDFAFAVAQKVAVEKGETKGILLCRSGGGMAIAANKVVGIRAANVFDQVSAKHAVEHNNANVLAFSRDWMTFDQVRELVEIVLQTKFSGEKRHLRRINKIKKFESKRS